MKGALGNRVMEVAGWPRPRPALISALMLNPYLSAVRRKNSVAGGSDTSFHRDSLGDCPRLAAARVGQRHRGAEVRLDLVHERARADCGHTNCVPHAFHEPWRSASGAPNVILVTEPAEDRPGTNILGRDTSHASDPLRGSFSDPLRGSIFTQLFQIPSEGPFSRNFFPACPTSHA
jgi:hypothetical protein